MTPTREDVVALARTLFGETALEEVLAIVDRYGTAPHEREIDRVKLAILAVSEGKKSRLTYFVACAKIDYRDVLGGQRLPPMSDAEEDAWQARADRRLAQWKVGGR